MELAAALAGCGVSRKQCRQLRGELRLEEDTFEGLHRHFRHDQRRVESALRRLLPQGEEVIQLLESCEERPDLIGTWEEPSAPSVPGRAPSTAAAAAGATDELREVWGALPRLQLGESMSQGHEERGRALRRRLKSLDASQQAVLKAQQTQLRAAGAAGAEEYLTNVWSLLQTTERRVEWMVDLIAAQTSELQRALRRALERRALPPSTLLACESRAVRAKGELLTLPEAYLLQSLSFCTCAELCALGAAGAQLQRLCEEDVLWCLHWAKWRLPGQVPNSEVRKHFLMMLATQCVECGALTDFEHAILGCRLCEACERSHSRYALIRSSLAIREFQLPLSAMQQLPGVDGSTGRVFLRSMVQQLAERQHTQESLQQLRAKNDMGYTSCGRRSERQSRRTATRVASKLRRSAVRIRPTCRRLRRGVTRILRYPGAFGGIGSKGKLFLPLSAEPDQSFAQKRSAEAFAGLPLRTVRCRVLWDPVGEPEKEGKRRYVPVKKYEIFDGVTFQWFMCGGILMAGFCSSVIFGNFGMSEEKDAMLIVYGGALWALANYLVLPLVKLLGIGLGFSLYHFVNLVVGYGIGRFGIFNMEKLTGNVEATGRWMTAFSQPRSWESRRADEHEVLVSFVIMVFVEEAGDKQQDLSDRQGLAESTQDELTEGGRSEQQSNQDFREKYTRWREDHVAPARRHSVIEAAGTVLVSYSTGETGGQLKSVGGFSVAQPPRLVAHRPEEPSSEAMPSDLEAAGDLEAPSPGAASRASRGEAVQSFLQVAEASAEPNTAAGRVGRKAVGVLLALLAGTLTGVQSRSEHGGAMRPHTWWGRMGPGMKDDAGPAAGFPAERNPAAPEPFASQRFEVRRRPAARRKLAEGLEARGPPLAKVYGLIDLIHTLMFVFGLTDA
ncbi:unnamed protein product [Durusdinium trenchii]|uniref:Uncharacterized protein n=1 Tax=Durusdinium trenchii TaxID=1381693 RepID=A0ABP0PVV1_9DINO